MSSLKRLWQRIQDETVIKHLQINNSNKRTVLLFLTKALVQSHWEWKTRPTNQSEKEEQPTDLNYRENYVLNIYNFYLSKTLCDSEFIPSISNSQLSPKYMYYIYICLEKQDPLSLIWHHWGRWAQNSEFLNLEFCILLQHLCLILLTLPSQHLITTCNISAEKLINIHTK